MRPILKLAVDNTSGAESLTPQGSTGMYQAGSFDSLRSNEYLPDADVDAYIGNALARRLTREMLAGAIVPTSSFDALYIARLEPDDVPTKSLQFLKLRRGLDDLSYEIEFKEE